MKPRQKPMSVNESTELNRLNALEEVVDRIVERITKSECNYCGKIGCEHQRMTQNMFSERQSRRDSGFLYWLADRLVNVYGESENTDFVRKTREVANMIDRMGL